MMEVLSGTTSEKQANELTRFRDRCRFYPVRSIFDSTGAAAIHRRCRRAGFTPRRLNDCVIAAVAFDRSVPVLHQDRDFERTAEATGLRIAA